MAASIGLSVGTPERMKSPALRVTIVRPCSRQVAARRPSQTGRGWGAVLTERRMAAAWLVARFTGQAEGTPCVRDADAGLGVVEGVASFRLRAYCIL